MNVCRKCGGSGVYLQVKGPQVGMYCDCCGSWIKWVSKSEQQIYRVRGTTIYAQGVDVKLKGTCKTQFLLDYSYLLQFHYLVQVLGWDLL